MGSMHYEARLTEDGKVLACAQFPLDPQHDNWAVLLRLPDAKLQGGFRNSKGAQVTVYPIANVRVFREAGQPGSTVGEESSFARPHLTLSVSQEALKKFGIKAPPAQCRIYMYGKADGKWLCLENKKGPAVEADYIPWDRNIGMVQAMVKKWPAGDPPIGIGDGSD